MPVKNDEITADGLLPILIVALNIALRNFRCYPAGHPMIEAAFNKVIAVYDTLLQLRPHFVLGVGRKALMLDGKYLDTDNTVYADFARTLFEREIGALILNAGLSVEDLRAFISVLALKREEILDRGGITAVWSESGSTTISIVAIQYELFTVTEEPEITADTPVMVQALLWEQFLRGLTSGRIDPAGKESPDLQEPKMVAEILNSEFSGLGPQRQVPYLELVSQYIRLSEQESLYSANSMIPYQRIAAVIERLSPELRRQFLSVSLDLRKSDGEPFVMNIAPHLSTETVLSALEATENGNLAIPPQVMGLLQKLGGVSGCGSVRQAVHHGEGEDAARIKTLFREHAIEEYVPADYLEKLNEIMDLDELQGVDLEGSGADLHDLDPCAVEGAVGNTLIYFIKYGIAGEDDNFLEEVLGELFGRYLRTGEYDSAVKMLQEALGSQVDEESRGRLAKTFTSDKYLEELMAGLRVGGKHLYPKIHPVITLLGPCCIPSLLYHLEEETNMPLRRFMMERIMEFGPQAKQYILPRLNDGRWYFVRNLLLIIREMDDPSTVTSIRPLLNHGNETVRQEALRVLLHFGDPQAHHQILKDLEDGNRETRLSAVTLCSACRSSKVFDQLARIVMKTGFTREVYEEREAAVAALAESGNPQTVPLFARILSSRNILAPRLHLKLKTDCMTHLEKHFRASLVRPLLDQVCQEGGELGASASAALVRLEKKAP
jgi:hypothetical protein